MDSTLHPLLLSSVPTVIVQSIHSCPCHLIGVLLAKRVRNQGMQNLGSGHFKIVNGDAILGKPHAWQCQCKSYPCFSECRACPESSVFKIGSFWLLRVTMISRFLCWPRWNGNVLKSIYINVSLLQLIRPKNLALPSQRRSSEVEGLGYSTWLFHNRFC